MGGEKQFFLNGIEVSGKVANGQSILRNVPERDFVESVKRGSDIIIERL
jgi:hypothetical protein